MNVYTGCDIWVVVRSSNWFGRLNEISAKHNEAEMSDVPQFNMEEGSQSFGDTRIMKCIYHLWTTNPQLFHPLLYSPDNNLLPEAMKNLLVLGVPVYLDSLLQLFLPSQCGRGPFYC